MGFQHSPLIISKPNHPDSGTSASCSICYGPESPATHSDSAGMNHHHMLLHQNQTSTEPSTTTASSQEELSSENNSTLLSSSYGSSMTCKKAIPLGSGLIRRSNSVSGVKAEMKMKMKMDVDMDSNTTSTSLKTCQCHRRHRHRHRHRKNHVGDDDEEDDAEEEEEEKRNLAGHRISTGDLIHYPNHHLLHLHPLDRSNDGNNDHINNYPPARSSFSGISTNHHNKQYNYSHQCLVIDDFLCNDQHHISAKMMSPTTMKTMKNKRSSKWEDAQKWLISNGSPSPQCLRHGSYGSSNNNEDNENNTEKINNNEYNNANISSNKNNIEINKNKNTNKSAGSTNTDNIHKINKRAGTYDNSINNSKINNSNSYNNSINNSKINNSNSYNNSINSNNTINNHNSGTNKNKNKKNGDSMTVRPGVVVNNIPTKRVVVAHERRDIGTQITPIPSSRTSRATSPFKQESANAGSSCSTRGIGSANEAAASPYDGAELAVDAPLHVMSRPPNSSAGHATSLKQEDIQKHLFGKITKHNHHHHHQAAVSPSPPENTIASDRWIDHNAAEEEADQQAQLKHSTKFSREAARINAWEEHQKAKAEAELKKLEMKLERLRSRATEKIMSRLAAVQVRAAEMRAQLAKTLHQNHHHNLNYNQYLHNIRFRSGSYISESLGVCFPAILP